LIHGAAFPSVLQQFLRDLGIAGVHERLPIVLGADVVGRPHPFTLSRSTMRRTASLS